LTQTQRLQKAEAGPATEDRIPRWLRRVAFIGELSSNQLLLTGPVLLQKPFYTACLGGNTTLYIMSVDEKTL
jgi:hypothetical protein